MSREAFGSFVTHQLQNSKSLAYYSSECVRKASPEHGMTVALEAETQGIFIKAYNTPEGVVHEVYRTTGTQAGDDVLIGKLKNGIFSPASENKGYLMGLCKMIV